MKKIVLLLFCLFLLISCGEDDISNQNTEDVTITEKFLKDNKLVKKGELYLYEGDMVFTKNDLKKIIKKKSSLKKTRGNLKPSTYESVISGTPYCIWAKQHKLDLSYTFSTDMAITGLSDAQVKQAFREAADVWMGAANIRFYEKTSGGRISVNRIDLPNETGLAWSAFPYSSYQYVELNRPRVNNFSYYVIRSIFIHELGHTLGLAHEHQRPESTNTYGQGYFGLSYGPYDPNSIMHYDNLFANFPSKISSGDTNTIRHAYQLLGSISQILNGDFNGDGKTDFAIIADGNAVQTYLSTATGTYKLVKYYPSQDYRTVGTGKWMAGDINGDGKADLVHIVCSGGTAANYMHPWISNGDGTYNVLRHVPSADYNNASGEWLSGDFNGDGKMDLAHLVNSNYINIHFGQLSGLFQSPYQFYPSGINGGYQIIGTGKWLTGDFNNDNKDDLVHIITVGTKNYMHPWYSKGDGTFDVYTYTRNGYDNSTGDWLKGDFDGDGKTDLIHLTGANYTHIHHSTGTNGQFNVTGPFNPPTGYALHNTGYWKTGDFNGDNKTDLIHIGTVNAADYVYTWLSTGDAAGSFNVVHYQHATYNTTLGAWGIGKINGDNQDDLMHIADDNYCHPWYSTGAGAFSIQQWFFQ